MVKLEPATRPAPSLFRQIAVRLALLTVVFALLDVAIVVPMYAFDQQALAEDFVEQQAHRVRAVLDASGSVALASSKLLALDAPAGVRNWGFVVVDESLHPALRRNAPMSPTSSMWPTRSTLDWARRESGPPGIQITGVRSFAGESGPYWVLIRADVVGTAAYLPVIGQELLEHVALPLVPLMALLLLFSVQVVGRMLAPLERAATEVDALDAVHMDARLTPPTSSREVAALVIAVNRALDRLQHAMLLLKTFTADAAHELRTPLSVMRLRTDELPASEVRERLSWDIESMTRMVNQMLDLAQADALRLDAAETVDLRALAIEVVSQIAPHAFAVGHDIRLTDNDAAPALGLPDALGRALRNLIENAIHHAPPGLPIEVIVGPGRKLSVRDHGPGLPQVDADKIFDRFWRASRSGGGAGLGLGIVRSIVEGHGGVVTAQNAVGGGALFECEFPPLLSVAADMRAAVASQAKVRSL